MPLTSKLCLLLGLSAVLLAPRSARATERHFGFSYESSVLNPGTAELAPWTTARAGRVDYYSRIDARLAFAYGLLKNLDGALFWNFQSVAQDVLVPAATHTVRLSETDFQSLSLDLKYKFSDPVADVLGCALYVEGTIGPQIDGFEGRLILDKQVGSLLFAANLVGGRSEKLDGSGIEVDGSSPREGLFGGTLAAAYFVTPTFAPSLEARSENQFSDGLDRSVVYLGPGLSLMTEGWWATLAVEPQIAAFKGASKGHQLDLDQNERLQARLLLGFHI